MRSISAIIIWIVLLSSCKKTKLEGDLSFLVGTWEWRYTVKTVDLCNYFPYDSLITNSPSIDGFTYSLTFEQKGILTVKKNGKKEKKYRVVLENTSIKTNRIIYYFKLNNKKKNLMSFTRYESRPLYIETTEFPLDFLSDKIDGCEDTHSVFEKVN